MGRLSEGRMGALQRGQWEPGHAMDWCWGSRAIQTLRKLPKISPVRAVTARNAQEAPPEN